MIIGDTMKKNIVIPIIIFWVVVIGISIGVLLLSKGKQKDLTIITLDINPSIEVSLDKEKKIVDVKALNDDAKKIISDDVKGKELKEGLIIIVDKLIENDYTRDGYVDVILYKEGQMENDYVIDEVTKAFRERDIDPHLAIIEEVSKEDKKLAKKYGITPAKAAYINQIIKDSDGLSFEDFTERPVKELKEYKESGRYCDKGYRLDGDSCVKENGSEPATASKVCPEGYVEFDNKCYLEGRHTRLDSYVCNEGFTLEGDKCYRTEEREARPAEWECTSGEKKTRLEMGLTGADAGDANDAVCVDLSKATHPVSPCELNDGTEWTKANGKCYWHRAPVIDTGCPGKIRVNGECWDDASNILICAGARDGKKYNSRGEICEGSIKYIDPVVTKYKCEEGFEVEGNKCIRKESYPAGNDIQCEDGSEKKDGRCIFKDKITEMIDGYRCEGPNLRLNGDKCIKLEVVEPKHK